jgi:putative SOS response-associated peptidase YedK
MDRLLSFFGVERLPGQPTPPEVWPLGLAPFIRLHDDGSGNKVIEDGLFGLLPHFAKELAYGRKTYNARSETVGTLPSFKEPWARGQRCIIPAEAVFEQCYETGKAVRWRVSQPGDIPMGIAGIYRRWRGPDGRSLFTFAMLTVNASGHKVYGRFGAPSDERRMVLILEPAEYNRWLQCSPDDAKSFFRQWAGPLDASSDPAAPRGAR